MKRFDLAALVKTNARSRAFKDSAADRLQQALDLRTRNGGRNRISEDRLKRSALLAVHFRNLSSIGQNCKQIVLAFESPP